MLISKVQVAPVIPAKAVITPSATVSKHKLQADDADETKQSGVKRRFESKSMIVNNFFISWLQSRGEDG